MARSLRPSLRRSLRPSLRPSLAALRRLGWLGGLAVALGAAAAPRVAAACSCEPTLRVQAPQDGDTLPSNGLLLIEAECGGDPGAFEVYVDGEQARLVYEPHRMLGLGYRIDPEPEPGAEVQLFGCPGFSDCDEARAEYGAESELPYGWIELSFTVGERDATAPAPPALQGLDYVVDEVEDFCGLDPDPRPAREWSLTIDGRADEPVLYHVSVGPAGDEPTRTRQLALDGDADLEIVLRRFAEDAGHDVCATVRTFDLTGNEADAVATCTELDRWDTLEPQGCACSARGGAGAGGQGAALVMVLLLGGWARRRRGR
ncbi:MAG: hypothetical protein KDK70_26635 [Myxococcales bacterium]|nr:hypothetical protein [Myxococcales bacterium]